MSAWSLPIYRPSCFCSDRHWERTWPLRNYLNTTSICFSTQVLTSTAAKETATAPMTSLPHFPQELVATVTSGKRIFPRHHCRLTPRICEKSHDGSFYELLACFSRASLFSGLISRSSCLVVQNSRFLHFFLLLTLVKECLRHWKTPRLRARVGKVCPLPDHQSTPFL